MKRFLWKLALFLCPPLLLLGSQLLLPLNFFTFRIWEALIVCQANGVLVGPFYPRQNLTMVEEGDLGHGVPGAAKTLATWQTDAYGFRKAISATTKPPVVVIAGDSTVAGTSLTQDDMLSEVLERMIGRGVYPFAPRTLNDFLRDERFYRDPPEVLVFAQMERFITSNPSLNSRIVPLAWHTNALLQQIALSLDRLRKREVQNYVRARFAKPPSTPRAHEMRFHSGEVANQDAPAEVVNRAVATLITYRDYLSARGIKFVFLPVPDKETIYWDYLPAQKQSTFLRQVIEVANRNHVATLDTLAAFEDARRQGVQLYQLEDTHWNKTGVYQAARLLAHFMAQPALSP
jgi:alginate O-acetyltransferase complex protein AlgJ